MCPKKSLCFPKSPAPQEPPVPHKAPYQPLRLLPALQDPPPAPQGPPCPPIAPRGPPHPQPRGCSRASTLSRALATPSRASKKSSS
ncbi:hypothetical protein llap_22379 [Limosa lapponica baueri]|uniref:Uncharacterized protein n=1 Tax=Limosa lapponica baueri TaxID=1758121 RepID=A0A2I0T0J5_LIMLA|nr:hypothetical protein llap_22379 [Limosa lapponica baueri]